MSTAAGIRCPSRRRSCKVGRNSGSQPVQCSLISRSSMAFPRRRETSFPQARLLRAFRYLARCTRVSLLENSEWDIDTVSGRTCSLSNLVVLLCLHRSHPREVRPYALRVIGVRIAYAKVVLRCGLQLTMALVKSIDKHMLKIELFPGAARFVSKPFR